MMTSRIVSSTIAFLMTFANTWNFFRHLQKPVVGAPAAASEKQMSILVQTLTGKSISLTARGIDTIKSIKRQIESENGYPPQLQGLVYKGKLLLEDDLSLSDYGMRAGDLLFLVLRLRP